LFLPRAQVLLPGAVLPQNAVQMGLNPLGPIVSEREDGQSPKGIRHPSPRPFFQSVLAAVGVRGPVGKAWVKSRKRDPFYRQAKAQGYRSRAAFKLIQVDARFDLIYEGDTVVDLGAAPGGWSQVARELVGSEGRVVAVDRVGMPPVAGIDFWKGDLGEEAFVADLVAAVARADVVISDMSPRLSGNRNLDHERGLALAHLALDFAGKVLRPGGNFLCKVFQGAHTDELRSEVERRFRTARAHVPEASRKESRELFVVGKGFKR